MPHLFIDKINEIKFPTKSGDVEFLFKVDDLVACKIEDKTFFISIRKKGDKYLLKYDKITRPISSLLKKAYKEFIKIADAKVISSNVEGIKDKISNTNEYLMTINDKFKFDREIIVEIGFGSGTHLLHLAKIYPDKIIIGIEIHKPSIEQILRRIKHEKITNVRIIDYDGRLVLSKIKSNNVHSIYVHFPVPWNKKPHRRVISQYFINEAIRTLKKDGFLHLRTDSDNYFEYSFNEFMKLNKNELKIYKNRNLDIVSKYESRWKKMEKNIYDIFLINEITSDDSNENFDFSLDCLDATKAQKKAYIFDDFVIHFERIEKIDNEKYLLKVTMGAFERPEHLYIIAGKKSYYFNKPIEHKLNQKVHNTLKGILQCQEKPEQD
jgi:tRNA (guanine-N7-)-methyltransferase